MSVGLLEDLRDGIDVHLAPLTVQQYEKMIRDGILLDGEPIELIQGALLYKDRRDQSGGIMTHGPRHLRTLNKLVAILSQWVVSKGLFLQVQGPIVVSQTSEPEPDCSLIRGTPDDYVNRVPQATDVLAVFEVAYSSLLSDRRTKKRLYASAGIPIYAIINLQDNVIEVMSEPLTNESTYRVTTNLQPSDLVSLELGEHGQFSFAGDSLL